MRLPNQLDTVNRQQANQYYHLSQPSVNNRDLELLALQNAQEGNIILANSAREANATNIALARESSAHSAQQAQKQMDFQQMMSSTAHQREMQDLISAGLNPILTATGGNGAAMGQGAMGHSAQGHVEAVYKKNPLDNLTQSLFSARKFKELELKQLDSQVSLQDTQRAKNLQEIETEKALQELTSAQAVRENINNRFLGIEKGISLTRSALGIALGLGGTANKLK